VSLQEIFDDLQKNIICDIENAFSIGYIVIMERPTWLTPQSPASFEPVCSADVAMRLRPKKGNPTQWPIRKAPGKPRAVVSYSRLTKRPELIAPFWHDPLLESSKGQSFANAPRSVRIVLTPCLSNG
jgi:hypothetical protein